jgi:hypothetical protein
VASTALQKVERPKGEEVSSELSFRRFNPGPQDVRGLTCRSTGGLLNSLPKEADDAMETAERNSDTAHDLCVS